VDRLDLMIRKSQLRSPITGVVARRHVEIGQWVRQGEAVADVVQLDPLHVRVNVPESVISRVKRGDQARVIIDALGSGERTATIDQILPEADPQSRTFAVKLLLPNEDLSVLPGFFARVVLVSQTQSAELLVPRDAVVTQQGRSHVVAVRDGAAAVVPVQLGPADGAMIAVTGELEEGEQVVTRGNEALQPGMPLTVLPSR